MRYLDLYDFDEFTEFRGDFVAFCHSSGHSPDDLWSTLFGLLHHTDRYFGRDDLDVARAVKTEFLIWRRMTAP